MSSISLESPQVALSCIMLSMRVAIFAAASHCREAENFAFFHPPKRAPLCGFTTRPSRSHCIMCTHRAVKAVCIAGSGSLALRVLGEQDQKIEKLTSFSSQLLSPAQAAAIVSSRWQSSSSKGYMYPCCFGPMLLALHARSTWAENWEAVGTKGLKFAPFKPRLASQTSSQQLLFPTASDS